MKRRLFRFALALSSLTGLCSGNLNAQQPWYGPLPHQPTSELRRIFDGDLDGCPSSLCNFGDPPMGTLPWPGTHFGPELVQTNSKPILEYGPPAPARACYPTDDSCDTCWFENQTGEDFGYGFDKPNLKAEEAPQQPAVSDEFLADDLNRDDSEASVADEAATYDESDYDFGTTEDESASSNESSDASDYDEYSYDEYADDELAGNQSKDEATSKDESSDEYAEYGYDDYGYDGSEYDEYGYETDGQDDSLDSEPNESNPTEVASDHGESGYDEYGYEGYDEYGYEDFQGDDNNAEPVEEATPESTVTDELGYDDNRDDFEYQYGEAAGIVDEHVDAPPVEPSQISSDEAFAEEYDDWGYGGYDDAEVEQTNEPIVLDYEYDLETYDLVYGHDDSDDVDLTADTEAATNDSEPVGVEDSLYNDVDEYSDFGESATEEYEFPATSDADYGLAQDADSSPTEEASTDEPSDERYPYDEEERYAEYPDYPYESVEESSIGGNNAADRAISRWERELEVEEATLPQPGYEFDALGSADPLSDVQPASEADYENEYSSRYASEQSTLESDYDNFQYDFDYEYGAEMENAELPQAASPNDSAASSDVESNHDYDYDYDELGYDYDNSADTDANDTEVAPAVGADSESQSSDYDYDYNSNEYEYEYDYDYNDDGADANTTAEPSSDDVDSDSDYNYDDYEPYDYDDYSSDDESSSEPDTESTDGQDTDSSYDDYDYQPYDYDDGSGAEADSDADTESTDSRDSESSYDDYDYKPYDYESDVDSYNQEDLEQQAYDRTVEEARWNRALQEVNTLTQMNVRGHSLATTVATVVAGARSLIDSDSMNDLLADAAARIDMLKCEQACMTGDYSALPDNQCYDEDWYANHEERMAMEAAVAELLGMTETVGNHVRTSMVRAFDQAVDVWMDASRAATILTTTNPLLWTIQR